MITKINIHINIMVIYAYYLFSSYLNKLIFKSLFYFYYNPPGIFFRLFLHNIFIVTPSFYFITYGEILVSILY